MLNNTHFGAYQTLAQLETNTCSGSTMLLPSYKGGDGPKEADGATQEVVEGKNLPRLKRARELEGNQGGPAINPKYC